MRIRNDVGRGRSDPPEALEDVQGMYEQHDRVLIACPECGRNHLAALTCPPANAGLIHHRRRDGTFMETVDEPEWHVEKAAA